MSPPTETAIPAIIHGGSQISSSATKIDRNPPAKWRSWPNLIFVDTRWYREVYQPELSKNSTMQVYVISWDVPWAEYPGEEWEEADQPEWLKSSTATCIAVKSTLDLASMQKEHSKLRQDMEQALQKLKSTHQCDLFSEVHDLLEGMAAGRTLPRSSELRALASRVIQSRKAEDDIEIWAKRLADDVANAAD